MNAANPHTPSLLLAATAEAVSGTSYSGGGKSLIFNNKESAKREHGPCVVSATDMAHGLFYAPAVALPARSNDSTTANRRYGHSSPRSNDSTVATTTAVREATILPRLQPRQPRKKRSDKQVIRIYHTIIH